MTSCRRTNDGSSQEVARSTAGATSGGDHGPLTLYEKAIQDGCLCHWVFAPSPLRKEPWWHIEERNPDCPVHDEYRSGYTYYWLRESDGVEVCQICGDLK